MSATLAGTGDNGTTTTRTVTGTIGEATRTTETVVLATTTTLRVLTTGSGVKDDGTTVTTDDATCLHPDPATKEARKHGEVREDSSKDRTAAAITTDNTTDPDPTGLGL